MLYLSSQVKPDSMVYLSTGFSYDIQAHVVRLGGALGYMLTPSHGLRLKVLADGQPWAADNGCYSQGASFDLTVYMDWLQNMRQAKETCLFATAPDVVGDARATWERSRYVLPQIRLLGYRAALVAQDGLAEMTIEWGSFDALFMGGTTEFKLSETAYAIAAEARRRGKWCHMGRVNSRSRLVAAAVSGYHSADGTMLAFQPDKKLKQLLGWLRELDTQSRFIA